MVKLTTIIILISILTVFLQFGVFYLLNSPLAAFLLSSLAVLIFTHIFLELSLGYNACFLYSILLIIFSALICGVLYIIPNNTSFIEHFIILEDTLFLLHYSYYGVLFLNWLLPMLYCIFRNLSDRGPRYVHFKQYFVNSSITFLLFYIASFIYQVFFNKFTLVTMNNPGDMKTLIPFIPLSSYVEAAFYQSLPISPFVFFVVISLLLYIPFGFYTRLFMKNSSAWMRILLYITFPCTIELVRFLLNIHPFVTDNVVLGILGCLTGSCLFNILNTIYIQVKDEEFLYERSPFTNFIQRYGGS